MVTIGDLTFEIFITDEELLQETASLGMQLSADYAGKELVFIAVLNGAFMFASRLSIFSTYQKYPHTKKKLKN